MAGGETNEDGDVGFQIAPMVDVVFVLLLFFMASAGSQIIAKELTINLPSGRASTKPGPPKTPTSKELPDLKQWLKDTIAKFGTEDPVIIKPDPQTKHERIIDVLNAAAAA